ncbi:MAG: succinate dehydrogenase, cytochrome b556 subunit [Sphingorhabdus sp.]
MAVSIFHRATGSMLATAGMMVLLWWLGAIASGPESYEIFQTYVIAAEEGATAWQTASNWFFRLLALGVTFSFFQHLCSGIRHLLMDVGAGYELRVNRTGAVAVFIVSLTATAAAALFVASRFLGV